MTPVDAAAPRAGARTFAALFLVTLSTLTYQLLLTRTFSVTMYYHFAFAAISLTMFGMAVGQSLFTCVLRYSSRNGSHGIWRSARRSLPSPSFSAT